MTTTHWLSQKERVKGILQKMQDELKRVHDEVSVHLKKDRSRRNTLAEQAANNNKDEAKPIFDKFMCDGKGYGSKAELLAALEEKKQDTLKWQAQFNKWGGFDNEYAAYCHGKASEFYVFTIEEISALPGGGGYGGGVDCDVMPPRRTMIVRVVKANLFRSFDTFGKMDPFAVVEWHGAHGQTLEIGRTKTDFGAHLTPKWHHTCRSCPCNSGVKLKISVLEENRMRDPTFCGAVTVDVDDLLAGLVANSPSNEGSGRKGSLDTMEPVDLKLIKKEEETGTVTVQVIHRPECGAAGVGEEAGYGKVDAALFVQPVKRLGVSGGTAPFFGLQLKAPTTEKSGSYWIGKDLSRAMDEITFYEERRKLDEDASAHGLQPLFDFMFEYAGVLECAVEGDAEDAPLKQLLVLRNLRDGCKNLRMLDIKMGEVTAAANWQGKSKFAAMRQGVIDGLTNSKAEGFRLEGFDSPPPSLTSMNPILDLRLGDPKDAKDMHKKAFRIMMQRMPAKEMFVHFFDVHQAPGGGDETDSKLAPSEFAEIVSSEVAKKLVDLAKACHMAPAPQKWIGSSIALGFDDKDLPDRDVPVEQLRSKVIVQIFDWGRSELNTLERHTNFSSDEQADRKEFWRYYAGGIRRLSWEAARTYWHRFGNSIQWEKVRLSLYDFDSNSANDYGGGADIELAPMEETSVPLLDVNGTPVRGPGGATTLTYSITWNACPVGSRLKGVWRIRILGCSNLPCLDQIQQTSDPFVEVEAYSKDNLHVFKQVTTVIEQNLNPQWDEVLELPIAASAPQILEDMFSGAEADAADLFTSGEQGYEKANQLWTECIKKSCKKKTISW